MSELAAISTLQTQPMRAEARPELATVTVVQFGPALSVSGGIAAVERLIVEHLPTLGSTSAIAVQHVATMERGSPLHKALVSHAP